MSDVKVCEVDEETHEAFQRSLARLSDAIPARNDIERRVAVVRIPASHVLDWFTFAVQGYPSHVGLLKLGGLPSGVRVLSVQADWRCRTFDFLIAHESFDPVPEGQVPPDVEALRQQWEMVRIPESSRSEQPCS
jgi:hypothetical protein